MNNCGAENVRGDMTVKVNERESLEIMEHYENEMRPSHRYFHAFAEKLRSKLSAVSKVDLIRSFDEEEEQDVVFSISLLAPPMTFFGICLDKTDELARHAVIKALEESAQGGKFLLWVRGGGVSLLVDKFGNSFLWPKDLKYFASLDFSEVLSENRNSLLPYGIS